MPGLSVAEHIDAVRREGDRMAAAVAGADLDAAVPTCPGWTLRELAHHLGRVHHWAAAHIEQARPGPLSDEEEHAAWGAMPADPDLVPWYRMANARLVAALAVAPPELACWSFLPAPSPLVFWAGRQAHEATIHRVDAQAVAGRVDPVPPGFAIDGVDELLLGFYSRTAGRLRSEEPLTLAVRTDAASWLVHIGPNGPKAQRGDGGADCTVYGPPSDVYLALWNRARLTDLEVGGDPAVLDLWAGKATVRWS